MPIPRLKKDQRIGEWTVLDPLVRLEEWRQYALVECSCGAPPEVRRVTQLLAMGERAMCKGCYHAGGMRGQGQQHPPKPPVKSRPIWEQVEYYMFQWGDERRVARHLKISQAKVVEWLERYCGYRGVFAQEE